MPNDDEDDERSKPDKRDDELLVPLASVHLQADCNRIDNKEDNNHQPIYSKDGGGQIVQFFEVGVVVVD